MIDERAFERAAVWWHDDDDDDDNFYHLDLINYWCYLELLSAMVQCKDAVTHWRELLFSIQGCSSQVLLSNLRHILHFTVGRWLVVLC